MNAFEAGTRTIYEIPAENFEKFEAQVAKLSRRAVKLGLDEIKPFVFDRENKKLADGQMHRVYKVFFNVDSPKLAGWTFAATLDHSNETGNIVRAVPNTGVQIPERYRTAESHCEHCRVRRYRRDTFIVCSEAGEFKQVGSTCLADFMGHDAYKIARMAEFLAYASECGRGAEQFVGGDLRFIDMEGFLANAACMIRHYGWVSGSAAYAADAMHTSTKSRAMENMFARPVDRPLKVLDEDVALAREALEWARGFEILRNLSDYQSNVLVIAKAEMIEPRSAGIAASIVGVYLKHKVRETERATQRATEAASQHVGLKDERLNFGPCLVVRATSKESEWGTTHIYTFKTAEGNVLTWFASKAMRLVAGETHVVTGTVKKHETFRDAKTTTITRCVLGDGKKKAA